MERRVTDEIWISVDVETSGPTPGTGSLIAIGACLVDDPAEGFSVELSPIPGLPWSEAAERIHGLSPERLAATGWTSDSNLDLATARALGEEIVVYVRDGNGNLAHATVTVPEPNAAAAVFACVTLAWRSRRRARRG